MDILKTASEMNSWSERARKEGSTIAFVPTMGALHEGHLSLVRKGKSAADVCVMSIYVNPTQFAANEDLTKYPRDLDGDLDKARASGVDAVFLPTDEVMYPDGFETSVNVEGVTENLCGKSRPSHFRGVATVVLKLFNIVEPSVAVFGEKDFQQLVVVKKMVDELNLPVDIIGHPIVRERDGLAMSSRNKYLNAEDRLIAASINRSLTMAEKTINEGERSADKITSAVRSELESAGVSRIDYVSLVDAVTLKDLATFTRPALLAVAAFVGKTRLIDNRLFK